MAFEERVGGRGGDGLEGSGDEEAEDEEVELEMAEEGAVVRGGGWEGVIGTGGVGLG